jgi:hypothetical protein
MGGMNRVRLLIGILDATVAMLGATQAQRLELPAAPNREVVSSQCQACHDLSMVLGSAGLSRDGWDGVIDEMVSYGMRITAEERAKILDYLANNLGSR